MPYDSLIRLRQISKPEVSGYVREIISNYLATGTGISVSSTGSLTGTFYPLNSNPNSYLTGSQSNLIFKSDTGNLVDTTYLASVENSILLEASGLYYSLSNPSGFINRASGDSAYARLGPAVNTGQLIFDDSVVVGYSIDFNPNKWFYLRGTGTSEIDFYNSLGPQITGFSIFSNNIKLSGKTVLNDAYQFLNVKDPAPNTGLYLKDNIKSIYPFAYNQGEIFLLSGINNSVIDLYDSRRSYSRPYISGFDIYVDKFYLNGSLFSGGSSGSSTGDVTFAQLTGASGVLRTDIELIRTQSGNLVSKSQTGVLLVGKNHTGNFLYNNMSGVVTLYGSYSINSKTHTALSVYPGVSYWLASEDFKRLIDLSGNANSNSISSPLISGFFISSTGMNISGQPVLHKTANDALYYSVTNPNDYASKNYVQTQISNLAILEGVTTENNSLYLSNSSDLKHAFIFDPSAKKYYLTGAITKGAAIDLVGTLSSGFINQPFISGFSITGAPIIWANEIYLSGVPIAEALSGLNTGNMISKYDDRHNTRLTLWNTGSLETGLHFSGGNGPFYLQYIYKYSHGAIEQKNKIDLQNSLISGFKIDSSEVRGTNGVFKGLYVDSIVPSGSEDGWIDVLNGALYDVNSVSTFSWHNRSLTGGIWSAQGLYISGSNVLLQSQTGILVGKNQTGALTDSFPTHAQTGNLLVGKNQTGIFLTSAVTIISGTTNQVNVSANTGAVTLSLPQSIATTSSPTFDSLTATNRLMTKDLRATGDLTGSFAGGFNIGGNTPVWVEISEMLAGTGYLGSSERFIIDIVGGFYQAAGFVRYIIGSRATTLSGGLNIKKFIYGDDVALHEIKIYSSDSASISGADKYKIGFNLGTGSVFYTTTVRAWETRNLKYCSMFTGVHPTGLTGWTDVTPFIDSGNISVGNITATGMTISGYSVVTSNQTGLFVTQANLTGSETSAFTYTLSSGYESVDVPYPTGFSTIPTSVNVDFINNIDSYIYTYSLASISTTGFTVNFSDILSASGYKLGILVKK